MGLTELQDWFKEECPERLREDADRIVSSLARVQSSRAPSRGDLEEMASGFSGPQTLFEVAAIALRSVDHSTDEFESFIGSLKASKKAGDRRGALRCLLSTTPVELSNSVVSAGLSDKSKRNRWVAIETAQALVLKGAVPKLKSLCSDEALGAEARQAVDLIEQGYTIVQEDSGTCIVTAINLQGDVSSVLCPKNEQVGSWVEDALKEIGTGPLYK